MPDLQVRAAHGRGQPGPAGQLARAAEPADVADLGHHDQCGELPDPRQRPERLDSGIGPGVLVQLTVDPVDHRRQAVDDRQAIGDDLPRCRRQVQLGQPAAAGPGPVAGRPVIAVVGGDRVDPVPQLGAEADQADPVPQQRAELADLRRGDPRLGQQVRSQQLRQNRGVDLVVLQPGRGDGLAPQRVHHVRLEAVVLQQIGQPAPAERGLERHRRPEGRSPISRRNGSEPFTTFLLTCTVPSSATTATWDRLRCTSIPT